MTAGPQEILKVEECLIESWREARRIALKALEGLGEEKKPKQLVDHMFKKSELFLNLDPSFNVELNLLNNLQGSQGAQWTGKKVAGGFASWTPIVTYLEQVA